MKHKQFHQFAVQAEMISPIPNGFDHTKLLPSEIRFAELVAEHCLQVIQQHADAYHNPVWSLGIINDIREQLEVQP